MCRAVKDQMKEPLAAVRLWSHECERVMADRLVSAADLGKFDGLRVNASKKFFEDVPQVLHCSTGLLLQWTRCRASLLCHGG